MRLSRIRYELDAIVAFEQQAQSRVIKDDNLVKKLSSLSREVADLTHQLEDRLRSNNR
jgi:hypothetical protein